MGATVRGTKRWMTAGAQQVQFVSTPPVGKSARTPRDSEADCTVAAFNARTSVQSLGGTGELCQLRDEAVGHFVSVCAIGATNNT